MTPEAETPTEERPVGVPVKVPSTPVKTDLRKHMVGMNLSDTEYGPFTQRPRQATDWWGWAEDQNMQPDVLAAQADYFETAIETVDPDQAETIRHMADAVYIEKISRVDAIQRTERTKRAVKTLSYQDALSKADEGTAVQVMGIVRRKLAGVM